MWVLVRILEKAGERIAQWNYVNVIRTRVPESRDASRNDGKGKDDANVDNERCDEQLRFVGGSQAGNRIQKTGDRRQEELRLTDSIRLLKYTPALKPDDRKLQKKNPPKLGRATVKVC